MQFKPFADRILCNILADNNSKTAGGIYLPPTQQANNMHYLNRFEVLDVGPGILNEDGTRKPMHVKPGDIIWGFKKYDVMVDATIYSVLDESCIVGVEEK